MVSIGVTAYKTEFLKPRQKQLTPSNCHPEDYELTQGIPKPNFPLFWMNCHVVGCFEVALNL